MKNITEISTKKQYHEVKKYFDNLIKEATEKGYLSDPNAENKYIIEIKKLGRLINQYERKNIDFGIFNTTRTAPYPSEVIKEEMQERELTQVELAEMLEMSKTQLNEILNGKRRINANISVRLEVVFDIPAEYWLRLQTAHDIDQARNEEKNQIQRLNFSRRYSIKQRKMKTL